MDHGADRRFDRQRQAIHQAVSYANAFDLEGSNRPRCSSGNFPNVSAFLESVLLELVFQQPEGEPGPEDRHLKVPQDIRQSAYVILVGMGQNDRFEPVFTLDEVGYVGYDEVDSKQIRSGEHYAAVDRDRRVSVLEQHHVEAEFAESAERYNF